MIATHAPRTPAVEARTAALAATRRVAEAARDRLIAHLLSPLLRGWCAPFEVGGLHHLDRVQGPVIFAANHASHLDAPAVLAALPAARRRTLMVAAAEDYFFRTPLRRWLTVAALPAFPFRRSGDPRCSLALTEELLASGRSVLLFPEGTRSLNGEVAPFRRGIALIASRTGVPVIPTSIEGTHAAMPKGARLPRRRPLAVAFGAPLEFDGTSSSAGFAAAVRERLLELR